jgi:hypothetical protein
MFTEKEWRLYEEEDLIQAVGSTPALALRDIAYFRFRRAAGVDYLLEQVRNNHYSTFCFYEREELEGAAQTFRANLEASFDDLNAMEWTEENVMFTAERL